MEAPQQGAPRILQLDASVVNRIAAGEVIHRPSSALKEMIENCLDARSTSIAVTVKSGGLALMQITDNGCGINRADFPLVCMRFATSKLASFDDLSRIRTYGFRGEALASISHVARVSIVSLPKGAPCAYRATFADGNVVGEVTPCAGTPGTTITVEDMFFNVPARKAALASPGEENRRVVEVVQRYAIRHASRGVSFTCKQAASVSPDVHIAAGTPTIDCIAALFGHSIKRELLPLEVSRQPPPAQEGGGVAAASPAGDDDSDGSALRFRASGFVSSANYSMKRGVCIFFINDRLVECAPLRKAMEVVYAEVLPKGTHPFMYVALEIPTTHVDVNVHPTKREVNFLHQDALVDAVVSALTATLHGANSSRAFQAQTVLLPLAALAAAGPGASELEGATAAGAAARGSGGGGGAPRSRRGGYTPAAVTAAAADGAGGDDEDIPILDAGASETLAASLIRGGVRATGAGIDIVTDGRAADDSDEDAAAARFAPAPRKDGRDDSDDEAAAPPTSTEARGLQRSALGAALAGRASLGLALRSAASATAAAGRMPAGAAAAAAAPRPSAASPYALSSAAYLSTTAPQKAVRIDSALSTIDAYLTTAGGGTARPGNGRAALRAATAAPQRGEEEEAAAEGGAGAAPDEVMAGAHEQESPPPPPPPPLLTSVRELLLGIRSARHEGLDLLIRRHALVGVLSESLSLVQHGTKLLLVNHEQLARELFYQQALRLFGRADAFALQPPLDVEAAAALALDARCVGPAAGRPALARQVAELLASKADMLREYFAIGIVEEEGEEAGGEGGSAEEGGQQHKRPRTDAGPSAAPSGGAAAAGAVRLTHLPRLVSGHTPQLPLLPDFVYSLAFEVDWAAEKECFHSLAQALGAFYARLPPVPRELSEAEAAEMRAEAEADASGEPRAEGAGEAAAAATETEAGPRVVAGPGGTHLWRGELVTVRPLEEHRVDPASAFWQVAHVLLPACRAALTPPAKLARSHHVVQLCCTEQLYKIFERC